MFSLAQVPTTGTTFQNGHASMSSPGELVDAHHHVWDLAIRDQPWTVQVPVLRRTFTADELAPFLPGAGIGGTVVVQTVNSSVETVELLAAAADTPWMLGVVGWADLTSPALADELTRLRALPAGGLLVGLRHQVQEEPDPGWLRRDDVGRGLQTLAEAGMTYDLIVQPEQWPAALAAVRATPQLSFVLDHLGNPPVAAGTRAVDEAWLAAIRGFAAAPNVAFKLSGLVTRTYPEPAQLDDLEPYVRALFDVVGVERVMFGSDWPVCTAVADYPDVVVAAQRLTEYLGPDAQEQIFRRSATAFYRLGFA
jgi:L-fuconolactonase